MVVLLSLITPTTAQQTQKNVVNDSNSFFLLLDLMDKGKKFQEALQFSDFIRNFLDIRVFRNPNFSEKADSVSKILDFLDLELGNAYSEELNLFQTKEFFSFLGDSTEGKFTEEKYLDLVSEVQNLIQQMRERSAGVQICKTKQYEQPKYTGKEGKSFVDVMYPEASSLKEKEYQYFSKEYQELLESSTFLITYVVTDEDGYKNRISGHCCLYESDANYSYLMLPLHVFNPISSFSDFDSIFLISSSGKSISLDFYNIDYQYVKVQDAEILRIPKLDGFVGLRKTIIGNSPIETNDSVRLITPFNISGITQKSGVYKTYGEFRVNEEQKAEPGDSGAPVLTQKGIKGVAVAIDPYGTVYFTPISVFEKLYLSVIFDLYY
jgi:hypothetical protein